MRREIDVDDFFRNGIDYRDEVLKSRSRTCPRRRNEKWSIPLDEHRGYHVPRIERKGEPAKLFYVAETSHRDLSPNHPHIFVQGVFLKATKILISELATISLE